MGRSVSDGRHPIHVKPALPTVSQPGGLSASGSVNGYRAWPFLLGRLPGGHLENCLERGVRIVGGARAAHHAHACAIGLPHAEQGAGSPGLQQPLGIHHRLKSALETLSGDGTTLTRARSGQRKPVRSP